MCNIHGLSYFVNTQKDVYKYCMPLCVNKIWCTVNASGDADFKNNHKSNNNAAFK